MEKKTIKEREEEFYKTLLPFLTKSSEPGKYAPAMLREFFDYWSEWNRSETKMKYELEKTWQLSKRLSRWARTDKSFKKPETPSTNYKDLTEKK